MKRILAFVLSMLLISGTVCTVSADFKQAAIHESNEIWMTRDTKTLMLGDSSWQEEKISGSYWYKLTGSDDADNPKLYVVVSDIENDYPILIQSGYVKLVLFGYTVKTTGNRETIRIRSNASLNLDGRGGILTHSSDKHDRAICSLGTLEISDVTITGNSEDCDGAGVYTRG